MFKRFIGLIFLLAASVSIQAATFTFLQSPSLAGQLQGPDGLWDTADDVTVINPGGYTGFNPQGGATNFLFNSLPIFGALTGSFETAGPEQIGNNQLTSFNADLTINNFTLPVAAIASPGTETLSATGVSSLTIAANNTATSTIIIDVEDGIDPDPTTFTLTGIYSYISNGDDPSILFAGNADLIDQFNYLLPLLPANWDKFFIGLENFVFVTGETGIQTGTFYTTFVPVPATVWLFGSALLGIIGISRKK